MKKESSIQRQFILYVVLPLLLIIIGAVILDSILGRSRETINVNPSGEMSSDQAATDFALQLNALDNTNTPPSKDNEKTSETGLPDQLNQTTTPQNTFLEKPETLFYAGFVVCGGIILLIIVAGGVLFLTPVKK